MPEPFAMKPALQFIVLSGAGWLLDFCLFWCAIVMLGLPPGPANVISATIAAMAVYLVSSRLVFGRSEASGKAMFIYLLYTEANIALWALAITVLAGLLAAMMAPIHAALVAKILVTPLSLTCNFLVTRFLVQRGRLAR
ncbi:GtrA family protein [Devosia sp.]|uniref:GtrA family protein n=1 Tax=Devosia sp. TaxID=1871048 RepID=UPI00326634D2